MHFTLGMYVVGFVGSICYDHHSSSLLHITFICLPTVYILEWAQVDSMLRTILTEIKYQTGHTNAKSGVGVGMFSENQLKVPPVCRTGPSGEWDILIQ